jgi:acyl-CoA thioesterase-2
MHAYFILTGDLSLPIIYQVERIRDGRSFNTRRVVAFQKGRPIFNMSASFQIEEEGFEHQVPMPTVKRQDSLITDVEWAEQHSGQIPEAYMKFMKRRYIDFKPVEQVDPRGTQKMPPYRHIWLKTEMPLGDDAALHKEALAFASDYNLVTTTLLPHRGDYQYQDMKIASLDHAMWFHRKLRADEWLLFAIESPSTSNSRGLGKGHFFNEQGELVATVIQEGLIRKKS